MVLFEKAWGLVKAVGPENFDYSVDLTPRELSFTNPLTGQEWAEEELGLQTTGSMPIKELLAHLEKVPSLKEIARGEGYYSLEDARKDGFNEKISDYDEPDDFYESLLEQGINQDSVEDWVRWSSELGQPFENYHDTLDTLNWPVKGRKYRIADSAANLRELVNRRSYGEDWRKFFPSLTKDKVMSSLESYRDEGNTRANVTSGGVGPTGLGPMIDVMPSFSGMGLGTATLASLLENTGMIQDSRMSQSGRNTIQSLIRQLNKDNIEYSLLDTMNSIPDPYNRELYPLRGSLKFGVPDNSRLISNQRDRKAGIDPLPLDMVIDQKEPMTDDKIKELLAESRKKAKTVGGVARLGGPYLQQYRNIDPEWLKPENNLPGW